MIKSIRWRLQAWYGLILTTVVVGFASLLYVQTRDARLAEIDRQLTAAVRYLEVNLRHFPPDQLEDGELQPPPRRPSPQHPFRDPPRERPMADGEPPPDRREEEVQPPPGRREREFDPPPRDRRTGEFEPRRRGPPPRPPLERLLAELTLPPSTFSLRPDDSPQDLPYFGVWRADGTEVKRSAAGVALPLTKEGIGSLDRSAPTLAQNGFFREALAIGPRSSRILVGKSIERDLADLRSFAWQLASSGAAVLGAGLLGGWLLSARVLRPLAAISATAASISENNLSGRIDDRAIETELAELAGVLNAMFARLEAAFERQARFTADASHELRTPLTVLQANLELALTRPRSDVEYRETMAACLKASRRMRALLDGLLTLARSDAKRLDLQLSPIDLSGLIDEVAAQYRSQAEKAGVTLLTKTHTSQATVSGDPLCIAQVLTNLLSNALRHTPKGGRVEIALSVDENAAEFSVSDSGCGVAAEYRPRLFDRFFRADAARARATGGNGLGLAICKSIVEAHGGTIAFIAPSGPGSLFVVRLPLDKI